MMKIVKEHKYKCRFDIIKLFIFYPNKYNFMEVKENLKFKRS